MRRVQDRAGRWHRTSPWRATLPALLLLIACAGSAQETPSTPSPGTHPSDTLETLYTVLTLQADLQRDIELVRQQIAKSQESAEKETLQVQLNQLQQDLRGTTHNLRNIAAGVDLSQLDQQKAEAFNLQEEVFGLLKPALDEMKQMTAEMRQKSQLREQIAYYQERLSIIEQALGNIERLLGESQRDTVKNSLDNLARLWRKQQALLQSQLQAAQLQYDKLLAADTSLAEASQTYLKSFFQRRGLYLLEATLVVLAILFLSRGSYRLMKRHVPGFNRRHRSFRVRLFELIHRIVTVLLVILGPMMVFFLVEDWVLFSLAVLLLIGIAFGLRQALPRYWHQIQLFLNIGSVREGERIEMEGLPWLVDQINVFCNLSNPVAGISQRVPIDALVGQKSRPCRAEEPWFPCTRGDWVILADGNRGKVTGISHELVQLVQRGGAQLTYSTGDFLSQSPRNLATNFRIKETLGISYQLQRNATTTIPQTLQALLGERLVEEGYGEALLNLRVEFERASNSSLDLVVIADFKGELGDLYNRLRRAIQRWCVDACSANGWEIPFPQLTVHGEIADH